MWRKFIKNSNLFAFLLTSGRPWPTWTTINWSADPFLPPTRRNPFVAACGTRRTRWSTIRWWCAPWLSRGARAPSRTTGGRGHSASWMVTSTHPHTHPSSTSGISCHPGREARIRSRSFSIGDQCRSRTKVGRTIGCCWVGKKSKVGGQTN